MPVTYTNKIMNNSWIQETTPGPQNYIQHKKKLFCCDTERKSIAINRLISRVGKGSKFTPLKQTKFQKRCVKVSRNPLDPLRKHNGSVYQMANSIKNVISCISTSLKELYF